MYRLGNSRGNSVELSPIGKLVVCTFKYCTSALSFGLTRKGRAGMTPGRPSLENKYFSVLKGPGFFSDI